MKPEATSEADWRDKSRQGTAVRIRGERGSYLVVYEAPPGSPHGEYVCIFGGPHTQTRHIRPDGIVWPRRKRSGKCVD